MINNTSQLTLNSNNQPMRTTTEAETEEHKRTPTVTSRTRIDLVDTALIGTGRQRQTRSADSYSLLTELSGRNCNSKKQTHEYLNNAKYILPTSTAKSWRNAEIELPFLTTATALSSSSNDDDGTMIASQVTNPFFDDPSEPNAQNKNNNNNNSKRRQITAAARSRLSPHNSFLRVVKRTMGRNNEADLGDKQRCQLLAANAAHNKKTRLAKLAAPLDDARRLVSKRFSCSSRSIKWDECSKTTGAIKAPLTAGEKQSAQCMTTTTTTTHQKQSNDGCRAARTRTSKTSTAHALLSYSSCASLSSNSSSSCTSSSIDSRLGLIAGCHNKRDAAHRHRRTGAAAGSTSSINDHPRTCLILMCALSVLFNPLFADWHRLVGYIGLVAFLAAMRSRRAFERTESDRLANSARKTCTAGAVVSLVLAALLLALLYLHTVLREMSELDAQLNSTQHAVNERGGSGSSATVRAKARLPLPPSLLVPRFIHKLHYEAKGGGGSPARAIRHNSMNGTAVNLTQQLTKSSDGGNWQRISALSAATIKNNTSRPPTTGISLHRSASTAATALTAATKRYDRLSILIDHDFISSLRLNDNQISL